MGTRIIVIPDIHDKIDNIEKLLNSESHDNVIFLGDYFDSFNGDQFEAIYTAEWLISSLKHKNRIHLFGNHDVHYLGNNNNTLCSGYTLAKKQAIRSFIKDEHISQLKWYHIQSNALFCHGGLHNSYITCAKNLDAIDKYLNTQVEFANRSLFENKGYHWFMHAGVVRGGHAPFGGLVWCDFYREFQHVDGITQIVGHTPRSYPHYIDDKDHNHWFEDFKIDGTWSLGLDTHLQHYALIEDNVCRIQRFE